MAHPRVADGGLVLQILRIAGE